MIDRTDVARPLRDVALLAWLLLVSLGQFAAIGVGLWGLAAPAPWLVVLGAAGVLGSFAMVWMLLRANARRSARQQAAQDAPTQRDLAVALQQTQAAEQRLREVINAIPAGVAIYDNQDRLVMYNDEVSHQYPYRSDHVVVGETYEALMRRALSGGKIPDAAGREEEWLALRMAGRGALNTPLLRHTDDGHWVHFYEIRTGSGYLVMTRLDITPMVEKGLALERANEQLLRLSTTDGLTGIANRRLFDRTLQTEWQRCARGQTSLSLLMIDVDHFKRYNDHFGHQTGDECLRQLARVLALCFKRSGELVARYGGEEFAVLLPGADSAEAAALAQQCLRELANARIPHADSPLSPWLSVSIGVATVVAAPELLPATLVGQAEAALLRAKGLGRARVEVFEAAPSNEPASPAAPR